MDTDAAGTTSAPPLSTAAIGALQGNKIEAIKITRQERHIGLKEAKDAVEDYLREHSALQSALADAQGQSRRSGALWLVVIVVVAYLAYRFLVNA